MATVEQEQINLKKEKTDINQTIEQAIKSISISLNQTKGRISCNLEAKKSLILADKLHLTNIIYNLLDNAIKYCKRIPEINIATHNLSNGIVIKLRDNGMGIPPRSKIGSSTSFTGSLAVIFMM